MVRVGDQQALLVRAIAACDINPTESSALWCFPKQQEFHKTISAVTSTAEIEVVSSRWDVQVHLMSQLLASMKHATKELLSEMKRQASKDKKVVQLEQKKRKEELAQQLMEQEAVAKKQITFEKEVMLFKLDFGGA